MKESPSHIKRNHFRPRGFACPYCFSFRCKTPGGLTRHEHACPKNPANAYNPPPLTPPFRGPSHAPSSESQSPSHAPPGLFDENQRFSSPPHTLAPQNNTPIYDSPRHIRWTQEGRLNIRVHPYLDGELFMHPIEMILIDPSL